MEPFCGRLFLPSYYCRLVIIVSIIIAIIILIIAYYCYYCCLSSLSVSLLSLSLLFIIAAWSSLWSIIILMMITIHGDIDDNDEDFNEKLVWTMIYVNLLPEESQLVFHWVGRHILPAGRKILIELLNYFFLPDRYWLSFLIILHARQILKKLLNNSSWRQKNIDRASKSFFRPDEILTLYLRFKIMIEYSVWSHSWLSFWTVWRDDDRGRLRC